jgi:hypothetical protein
MENYGGMILTGKNRRTRRKTCASANLSITNLTWIDKGTNPGLCGERPATNRLSHGTAHTTVSVFSPVTQSHNPDITTQYRHPHRRENHKPHVTQETVDTAR